MSTETSYYIDQVKNIRNLRAAWNHIRSNCRISPSEKIRQEAAEFDADSGRHLSRVQRQIRENRFVFPPSYGLAKESKPGKKRPIVLPSIETRIVQRAILQVLQKNNEIRQLIENPTSCGGIKERGVRYAVEMAHDKIVADGKYFIRSDIKSFFTQISKAHVLGRIKNHVSDPQFDDLIERATMVVLSNQFSLGADYKLFPTSDLGVAQGSCLSPLFGNIVLSEFDEKLNTHDVLCIRYIDDFILIGPTQKAVNATLKKGLKILSDLDLEAYDPKIDREKAESGETSKGFEFLGCHIRPNQITPKKESRKRLIQSVETKIKFSKIQLRTKEPKRPLGKMSFVETLNEINKSVKAWGNQYQFCNNHQILEQMDGKISDLIEDYQSHFSSQMNWISPEKNLVKRRLLGVHALVDSKSNPVVKAKISSQS
ncbi:reverse transcriptase domain-containing protein [Parahaliea mediterranea]|uniref:reverse transcriptase domain-containing protein n=1 Tax=Parahaliea mediterranea TaxID=651086 RepID=UPI00130034A2|nr:reverse transcriptase domain-containing protein [Parahaliea mediterranea]